jgi:hypothetical protein
MIKQLLLLVAVVVILTGGFVAYAQTRPTVKTTWEYTVVLISQPVSIEKDLNQMGTQVGNWSLSMATCSRAFLCFEAP